MNLRRGHLALLAVFPLAFVCGSTAPLLAQAPAQPPMQTPAQAAAPAQQLAPSVLAKVSDDAVGWLRGLLVINTTNPPGNEAKAAEYIKGILTAEGIPAEILEVAPGRSAVVARLRSSALPDPTRALLLLGHLDVVGVDKSKWTVDPFGAVLKDGYLYGRGAIDDKGMLTANLAAFVALKRSGARLDRDVIFLASTDEEQGGDASIKTLIAKYWDKFASGFAINEGGRVMTKDGKIQYVGIQASEKIPYNVSVISTGRSGHASIPRKDNSVVHLAEAVAKIAAYQPPAKPSVIVRRYFEQLTKIEDPDTSKWMRALETPDRAEHAARVLSDMDPAWNSMLHDSIAPTMLEAGIRANVVPSEARAVLNIRLLPGDLIDPLIAELKKAVNDPQIRFEVQKDAGMTALPSSIESDLYKSIERSATEEFPDAVVLPYLSTGATDSAQLRLHNVQAYGLLPFPLVEEDERRMHADDERIPLASFQKGIAFLYRVVSEFAQAR